MISCRKCIQLSISFRSVLVSTGGCEEGGHRLQLNHNDFVFNLHVFDAEAVSVSAVHVCVYIPCTWVGGSGGIETVGRQE